MQIRQLDKDGDWTFGQGKANYLKNDNAIKLNIQTRYNEWVGDCFFNATAGIDWLNVFGFNQLDAILVNVKRLILQSEGVVELQDLGYALPPSRNLSIQYSIKTIYSPSVVGQLLRQGGINA